MNTNGKYQQKRWTLKTLLPAPDGPEVEQTVEKLETVTTAIEALRPTLSPEMTGEDFATVLGMVETFAEIANRLGSYGQLWFSEDTQNQAALAFMGRMEPTADGCVQSDSLF